MSEMIERVAHAMAAKDSGQIGSILFKMHWAEFGDGYLSVARAAIEAMRDPTEEMVDAGVTADFGKNLGERVTFAHQAMIDAALHP